MDDFRKTAASLLRNGDLADALFRHIGAVAVSVETQRIVTATEYAARLFGYEDLDGMLLEDLMPPRYRGGHGAHFRSFLADPSPRVMGGGGCVPGLHASGKVVEVHVFPLCVEEVRGASCAIAGVIPS